LGGDEIVRWRICGWWRRRRFRRRRWVGRRWGMECVRERWEEGAQETRWDGKWWEEGEGLESC